MTRKKIIFLILIFIFSLILVIIMLSDKNNFISLNYQDIKQKIANKESFVLCITATDCIHCQDFKPKLEQVANKYDINIYYTEYDLFNENDYNNFKKDFSLDGSTPTTIFFIDGQEKTTATRIYGDVSTDKIINKLKKNGFINEQ